MISLGYLGEAQKLDLPNSTIKMLIVRKPVSGIPSGFHHFPTLSPSTKLFSLTRRWKNNSFNEEEIRKLNFLNIDIDSTDAWWHLYKPKFEKELRTRKDMKQGLQILKKYVEREKEIYLFCYCKDLCTCHRLLVGKYLKEEGFTVNFREEEKKKKTIQLNLF